MNEYPIILFFHVAGALGFFTALGLEWISLFQARRVPTVEEVQPWLRLARNSYRVGMPSMITLLLTGLHMMAKVWGGVGWIFVSLGALVLIVVVVLAFIRPQMAAIGRALAAAQGSISPDLALQLRHPRLWFALQMRFALALGIVFLMTVKPDLISSLLALGVFVGLGLASVLPLVGQSSPQPQVG
jgi:hypothetical protein